MKGGMGNERTAMYQMKITEVGAMVPAIAEERLLILFGPKATAELKDLCVLHDMPQIPGDAGDLLRVGGTISFGDEVFEIRRVGSAANANFKELGHVSVYFRNEIGEILPGAIIVSPGSFPSIQAGDTIVFA